MRPLRPLLAAFLLLLAGAADVSARVGARDVHPAPRGLAPVAALTDSLSLAGRTDSVKAVLGPLADAARARGDRATTAWLRRREAELLLVSGYLRDGFEAADEAVTLGRALRDTATWISALRWRYVGLSQEGRMDEARRDLEEMRRLATLARDPYHLAYAQLADSWIAWARGDLGRALIDATAAAETLRRVGGPNDEAFARLAAVRPALRVGRYEDARRSAWRALQLARLAETPRLEAFALGDLGMIELDAGDPASGERYYRRCYELNYRLGAHQNVTFVGTSLAQTLDALGRYEEAAALLDSLRDVADERGFRYQLPMILETLGRVRETQGRLHQAAEAYRQSLALGALASDGDRVDALAGLSRVLAARDSGAAALALLEREWPAMRRSTNRHSLAAFELARGQRLLGVGRDAEAARELARIGSEMESLELWIGAAEAWLGAARAARALGRGDEALARLDRAEAAWERSRDAASAAEWRERRGADMPDLVETDVALRLELPAGADPAARRRAAFERLQRFKSRTLLERMMGPAATAASAFKPTTLERLQRLILRDDELLIDTFVGPTQAFAFAVTRDSLRVVRLGEGPSVTELCRRYGELTAALPSGAASRVPSGAATGRVRGLLLGGFEDLVSRASTVLLVPDGAIHRVPLAVLIASEDRRRATVVLPSATTLDRLRSRVAPADSSGGLLAVAWSGYQRLRGAEAEVRELGDAYIGARAVYAADSGDPSLDVRDLPAHAGLHFAGHTHVDDSRPWLSELAGVRGSGGGALRAGEIAGLALPSRLVVLSSCASGRGAVLSGEGVAGLSSAFIAAGAGAVVATLWPVDDATTRRFMLRFYDELSRGRSAAQALAAAQRFVGSRRATSAPFYWGGFVLVGDGEMRLPLERRAPLARLVRSVLPLALAMLAGVGLLAVIVRRALVYYRKARA